MFQLEWFKTDRDMVVGDLVYFIKTDGALDNKWTIGMVESVDRGRDGVIRKATIKYCNSSEQKLSLRKGAGQDDATFPRYTERAVRKLVKIFSLEEISLAEDMAELLRRETELSKAGEAAGAEGVSDLQQAGNDDVDVLTGPAANTRAKKCNVCCCLAHCGYCLHISPKTTQLEVLPLAMDTEMMTLSVFWRSV